MLEPCEPQPQARRACECSSRASRSRRRLCVGRGEPMTDRVSIVVCTKDRREELRRALASIADAGAEGAEIVVVEETDAPAPVAGTTYVAIPRESRGFGHARNRGLRAAAGDILVFFDDDCIATP